MKFNLLSDNRRIVEVAMLVGVILVCVGVFMQIGSIAERYSLFVLAPGSLGTLWSGFSHNIVKTKESGIIPTHSKVIGNISFLILAVSLGIFLTWIYVKTL